MKHLMVDLETVNNTPNSAVVSACLMYFDMDTGETFPPHKFNVSLQSSLDLGLTIGEDTFYWWLNNSQAARDSINPKRSGKEAVTWESIYATLASMDFDYIWSRGSDFDIAILRNAFEKMNKPDLINFKGRCIRTMQHIAPNVYNGAVTSYKQSVTDFTEHNAVHDCIAQVKGVSAVHNYIIQLQ